MSKHIKQTAWLIVLLSAWAAAVVPAQAASFDCAKATTKVEKLICADAALSKLDEELTKVYGEVLKKSLDEALLKKQQRASLKARNQCKGIACLSEH